MAASLNTLNELQCLVIWAQTLGLPAGPENLNELQLLKIIAGNYLSSQPLNGKNELDCLKIIAAGVSANGYPYNGLNEFQCLVVIAKALGLEPNFPGGNELDALRLIAANASPPVTAPVNAVPPVITSSGDINNPVQGDILTIVSDGTWTGGGITYTYQWYFYSLGPTSPIAGQTNISYTVDGDAFGDLGKQLIAQITATNSAGSADAFSNVTGTVISPP